VAAVLEPTPEGTLRLSSENTAELQRITVEVACSDGGRLREVLEHEIGVETGRLEALLADWVTPLRVAAARTVARTLEVGPGASIAAGELLARISLSGLLRSVVDSGGTAAGGDEYAQVDPERLLALLLHAGVTLEDEQHDVLELSPAFLDRRDDQQRRIRRWKAAQRREHLGELLLVDGHELSEAFRLAGFPDSVAELMVLHRFTALTSLPLWTAWQALIAFERPFQPVDGDSFDPWCSGDAVVLVSSPSSPPAQAMEATLAEAVRGQELAVAVINADDEPELCARLEVERPPMVLVLRDGEELLRTVWSPTPIQLRAQITEALGGTVGIDTDRLPVLDHD
ncbi:MAG: thioredoxin family protein, partial [Actinomycetota bacterium]